MVDKALDDNPDLCLWEQHDPQAWNEAVDQAHLLRHLTAWRNKPAEELYAEVVSRVRAKYPESLTPNPDYIWEEEKFSDIPEVHQALKNFAEDPTEGNGEKVILAVLNTL